MKLSRIAAQVLALALCVVCAWVAVAGAEDCHSLVSQNDHTYATMTCVWHCPGGDVDADNCLTEIWTTGFNCSAGTSSCGTACTDVYWRDSIHYRCLCTGPVCDPDTYTLGMWEVCPVCP